MIKLDCTLRDGGYYNNWKFSKKFVENYLILMAKINVDFIEVGYRSFSRISKYGPYSHCSEKFLSTLKIPSTLSDKLCVMINCSDFRSCNNGFLLKQKINNLFSQKSESLISLVRIACSSEDLNLAKIISKNLKSIGYKVAINIMHCDTLSKTDLNNIFSIFSEDSNVDVLYFGDSLGAAKSYNFESIINISRNFKPKPLGIHLHNNMNDSIQRSLHCLDIGFKWIDMTLDGMGRGAGNLQTELFYIEAKFDMKIIVSLHIFIDKFISPLKRKYLWGPNSLYYMAAKNEIHPTYVQNLYEDKSFSIYDKLNSLTYLSTKIVKTREYNNLIFFESLNDINPNLNTKWNPKKSELLNSNVMLLARGESIKSNLDILLKFAKRKKLLVMTLNYINIIDQNYVDYVFISHPLRYFGDSKLVSCGTKLICPKFSFIQKNDNQFESRYYGVKVIPKKFNTHQFFCEIPFLNNFAYAMAVLLQAKVNNIYFAGFDGYTLKNRKNDENSEIINLINSKNHSTNLVSLTKTPLSINYIESFS